MNDDRDRQQAWMDFLDAEHRRLKIIERRWELVYLIVASAFLGIVGWLMFQ